MDKNHNNMCDGGHCISSTGEVRVLPTGGDSNAILCKACFDHEMRYRFGRNRDLCKENQYKPVYWARLKVYDPS